MSLEVADAMKALKHAMKIDPSYAHTWFANLSMCVVDSGGTHEQGNKMAAMFMRQAFELTQAQMEIISDGGKAYAALNPAPEIDLLDIDKAAIAALNDRGRGAVTTFNDSGDCGEDPEAARQRKLLAAFQVTLNANSTENESDTPDFILARVLYDALHSFEEATKRRQIWYGD